MLALSYCNPGLIVSIERFLISSGNSDQGLPLLRLSEVVGCLVHCGKTNSAAQYKRYLCKSPKSSVVFPCESYTGRPGPLSPDWSRVIPGHLLDSPGCLGTCLGIRLSHSCPRPVD
ncbi:hypothetical protein RRG08_031163 [Elysia crispata]|uniref:Uncharacterized protein n=1 Tax=Elysia crispata TaxID=231223 RepID=A0AAE1DFW4_9GAST|nr:hypothetical protein RRG08_031163 [Elysia crispata]